MFDKENFKANIEGIISRIPEKFHTEVDFYVTDSEANVVTVITRDDESLKLIATTLCEEDHLVDFVAGSNFLPVRPNPCPTPMECVITHIPISFSEAITLVKAAGFGVIEDIRDGLVHVTAVGYNNAQREDISKIVTKLCAGGIIVTYMGVGNFFEFNDVQASSAFEKDTLVKIA